MQLMLSIIRLISENPMDYVYSYVLRISIIPRLPCCITTIYINERTEWNFPIQRFTVESSYIMNQVFLQGERKAYMSPVVSMYAWIKLEIVFKSHSD